MTAEKTPAEDARTGAAGTNRSRAELIRIITQEVIEVLREETAAACACGSPSGACACSSNEVAGEPLIELCRDWEISRVGGVPGTVPLPGLAPLIDHTLLKPEATRSEIERLCAEARQHGFASVCVQPYWVSLCARLLLGTPVKVCSVVGFPHGMNKAETKCFEARRAVLDGATELDMVINIGALKSRDAATAEKDIRAVVECGKPRASIKVILETSSLTDDEKREGCRLAKVAGADFVKTSTGFGPGGATLEDVALLRRAVGPRMGVKAAGGIRNADIARRMVEAGASRIGSSASLKIVQEERALSPAPRVIRRA